MPGVREELGVVERERLLGMKWKIYTLPDELGCKEFIGFIWTGEPYTDAGPVDVRLDNGQWKFTRNASPVANLIAANFVLEGSR
jgi:hypothetical protein